MAVLRCLVALVLNVSERVARRELRELSLPILLQLPRSIVRAQLSCNATMKSMSVTMLNTHRYYSSATCSNHSDSSGRVPPSVGFELSHV